MYELKIQEFNGIKGLDSRDVAVMVGRVHKELLKTIRLYIDHLNESEYAPVKFFIESTYKDAKGQSQPCYLITKKGCDMIANKMQGKFFLKLS